MTVEPTCWLAAGSDAEWPQSCQTKTIKNVDYRLHKNRKSPKTMTECGNSNRIFEYSNCKNNYSSCIPVVEYSWHPFLDTVWSRPNITGG